MCATCGCGTDHSHAHEHPHHEHAHHHEHEHHDHEHHHDHDDAGARVVAFEAAVLARNQHLAEHNRAWLRRHEVIAVNLMSSPGAGKTTLLERTLAERAVTPSWVIEGDQETQADAERIRAAGGRAVQINTGTGCHLDAAMIARALDELQPRGGLLFIENVGNLVCPALFDLGEAARVVIAAVTEGEDKPLKYPHMFRAAELVLLNKIDLLPHVEFSVATFTAHAHKVNPRARVVPLSARTGAGGAVWLDFLRGLASGARAHG
jgi:hydrogenase nickel incorporation protein HypB